MLSLMVNFIFRCMVQFFCKMTLKFCIFLGTFFEIKIFKFKQPNFFELEYEDRTCTNIGATNLVNKRFICTRYFSFFLNFSYFREFACHIICQLRQKFCTCKKAITESCFFAKKNIFILCQKRKSRKTQKVI